MEIGDRVKVIQKNGCGIPVGTTGIILHKFGQVYHVMFDYKDYKVDGYIFETRIKKIRDKYITLKEADEMALREQREQIDTIRLVNEFCDKLSKEV